jgi:ATP-dependent DNA helicase RecG
MMEKVGRGSLLIRDCCAEQGLPTTEWRSDPEPGVTLTFFATEVTPEVMRVLNALTGDMSRRELQNKLRLKDDEDFRKAYLLPVLKTGFIEMTYDMPKNRMQKYRLTGRSQIAWKSGDKN